MNEQQTERLIVALEKLAASNAAFTAKWMESIDERIQVLNESERAFTERTKHEIVVHGVHARDIEINNEVMAEFGVTPKDILMLRMFDQLFGLHDNLQWKEKKLDLNATMADLKAKIADIIGKVKPMPTPATGTGG